MSTPSAPPETSRLFLIDGYALIYRAFFALISRPLTTGRGENTSAAWGIANFLQRLLAKYNPQYVGWVHDSGLSFRHERYPAYKATREKLSDELQADFDQGVERIEQLLRAYHIPVLSVEGYEADDVIGTLAVQGLSRGLNVVIVSGDKDFHQLVQPGIWLLNPGRGGPAAVDEQWIGVENETERLGVGGRFVTDYLALVGDSSDNVPGVKGIGEKTAVELIQTYGGLEDILTNAESISKKRPREALLSQVDNARLSKELVTIRTDVGISLDLDALRVQSPDSARLRDSFVELEFHSLAKAAAAEDEGAAASTVVSREARYRSLTSVADVRTVVDRARDAGRVAFDTETILEPGAPGAADPLRAILVGVTLCVGPGESYYLPFRHMVAGPAQTALALNDTTPEATALGARLQSAPGNLPPLTSPELQPLRDLLEDATVAKIAQNGKYDALVLRREGINVANLAFDTMVASYVLDPGGARMVWIRGIGIPRVSDDLVRRCVRQRERAPSPLPRFQSPWPRPTHARMETSHSRLAAIFGEQLDQLGLRPLFDKIEMPLIPVLADMEAAGISIDLSAFAALKVELVRNAPG